MSGAADSRELEALVRERIDRWRSGDVPDAAAALEEHPELRQSKTHVMDLVLAEYSLRAAAGDAVSKSQFCERFPAYRQSIANLLDVEQYFLDKCPPDGVTDGGVHWPLPGDDFLGFEIIEPLGVGALARVFLAREAAVGDRLVVIKISPFGTREAHALGKLSHPSIVQILSTDRDDLDGWTVICMPLAGVATAVDLLDCAFADGAFADGARRDGALVARIARETKPLVELPPSDQPAERFDWNLTYPEAVARMGLQLAEALGAAHAAGILHRDIKPSNILLAWSGRPMLLDFNLSADASSGQRGVCGTLAYMAPELIASLIDDNKAATSGRGACDPQGDIYSLGAVLYELLTGNLPAKPEDAEHLPLNAYEPWLECKRREPQALVGGEGAIDPRLAKLVLKCLAFDQAARYESAAELAEELRRYLSGPARVGRFVKRRRREVVLSAVALIGMVFGLAAYIGSRPTALELAYRQGLEQYNSGQFDEAVASFTKCLELKSGWPHAHFGRAQALRRLGKWTDARTDFNALQETDRAWASALTGYCNIQLRNDSQAFANFMSAHQNGLRDVGLLNNYARTEARRLRYDDAIKLYTEAIAIDPRNTIALRNRALAYVAKVINGKSLPHQQAFDDAQECCRLEPDSFEAAGVAATVFGEAARKDPTYENAAIDYLAEALRRGMPAGRVAALRPAQRRLIPFIDASVVFSAPSNDPAYRFDLAPIQDPPMTANWDAFRRSVALQPSGLARSK